MKVLSSGKRRLIHLVHMPAMQVVGISMRACLSTASMRVFSKKNSKERSEKRRVHMSSMRVVKARAGEGVRFP